jgi:hypothetical protein
VEQAIDGALGNKPYSKKSKIYTNSIFLLTKCQGACPTIGVNDCITKAAKMSPTFPTWQRSDIEARQSFLVRTALTVWGIPQQCRAAASECESMEAAAHS